MRGSNPFALLLSLSLLFCAACSSSSRNDDVTGEGSLRALHAIPNIGTVNFLIEETILGSMGFQDATAVSEYDDLEYTFSFEITLPDDDVDEPTELVARTLSVRSDQEYTFVLSGSLDNPQLFLWEQFGRDWLEEIEDAEDNDTEVTVMEVAFGHISNVLGQVDIYLEAPGTSPLAATPKASLSYSEFDSAIELDAGDYQLVVTPAGDPNTLLFASDPFSISAATSTLVTLIDDGGFTTADFSVRLIGSGTQLTDINTSAVISATHLARGTDALDVYDSSDFSTPLFGNLQFEALTEEIEVEDGTLDLAVTPAGNLGVFLSQFSLTAFNGTYNRLYFIGLPGDLQVVSRRYDRSTLATHARLQMFQAAARFQTVDLYVVDTDTDIQLIGPNYSRILFGSGFSYNIFEADAYNIYVTEPDTKNVIAGPLRVDLEVGRNYSLFVLDSQNLSATELVFFEESAP